MTHPSFVTNGASLEDCHTNFFALADLCGIKWRRLCADSVLCVDPLDDPVLASFSKCLAADILCVWRRVAPRHDHQQRSATIDTSNQLNFNKELWIFWYGEEPDLSSLVCPELTADAEQGSWESGLSYECRSLLFKALHNLIERCLLSRGFTRLGKWFVQPYEGTDKQGKGPQLTFAFNFFVHGESTVCASVDVRQHPAVFSLNKHHLLAAQGSHSGLKVILSPYGLQGTLTGQSFKETDPATQRLLSEWRQFYPLPSKDHGSKEVMGEDDVLSCAVEIVVAGVKMRYPSCYVFVTEHDGVTISKATVTPSRGQSCGVFPLSSGSAATIPTSQPSLKSGPLMGMLTPPTSPCDPSNLNTSHLSHKTSPLLGSTPLPSQPQQQLQLPMFSSHCPATSTRVKNCVWQDSTIPFPRGSLAAAEACTPEEAVGHWEFADPCVRTNCACFRCKNKGKPGSAGSSKPSTTSNTGLNNSSGAAAGTNPSSTTPGSGTSNINVPPPGGGSSGGSGSSSVASNTSAPPLRKSDKTERDKVQQRIRGITPFHRRSPIMESFPVLDFDSVLNVQVAPLGSAMAPTSLSARTTNGNFQYRGPANFMPTARASTPSALPQLQTSLTQPSSVDSPHPATPSLLDRPSSQMSVADPTMPTLSPHPPQTKEEDVPRAESQEQIVPVHSPVSTPETSTVKEKSQLEQLLSPYQGTPGTLSETSKPPDSSPGLGATQWPTPPEEAVQTPTATQPAPTPVQPTLVSQSHLPAHGIKRPVLPVSSHEDLEDDDSLVTTLLYDYSSFSVTQWDLQPSKRQRLGSGPGVRRDSASDLYGPQLSHPYRRDSVKQAEDNEPLPVQPKDPYEFNDEFDEDSPSSGTGFRNRMDVFIKEEEKKDVITPQTTEPPVPPPAQKETPKPNFVNEIVCAASPPTPRNQGSSFTREEDLQVTDRDLENIFDTSSSDDSNDDTFHPPSTPSSVKLPSSSDEPACGKTNKNNTTCPTNVLELTRMFPTPPSLEHNTAPSPSGTSLGQDMTVVDSGDMTILRDRCDGYPFYGSPGLEPVRDWSYVYKPVVQQKFVSSSRYAALNSLPGTNLLPLPMPPECTYKPSWQQLVDNSIGTVPSGPPSLLGPSHTTGLLPAVDRHTSHSHHPQALETERMLGNVFVTDSSLDQRSLPLSYELQSPASNASSYLNKHLNSIDNTSTVSPIPEAHSLLVNLILSDSMVNLFKDHNFSSCTLCVCNTNIKGADVGVYLPESMVASGADEPQYKCTCGFSAVVNRHLSYHSVLFYEDEVEITLIPYEPADRQRRSLSNQEHGLRRGTCMDGSVPTSVSDHKDPALAALDRVPHNILDLMKLQCSMLYSSCSLFCKAVLLQTLDKTYPPYNALEVSDGCDVCFIALDAGRQVIDNINNNKLDESLKPSCLHKWPYQQAKLPVSNHDIVRLLRMLQPLLQEAVQKKRTQGLWEVTYTVSGPLTWRQFHRLAGRGTEDQCEPQPIPSLLVGYDKDWLALSPYTLKYWEKLLLEPYSTPRDVAYVVVAPDNEFILSRVRIFFKELSSVYEVCRLGRHCPITKVLRDGIMRVGKTAAKKLADQPVDEWFTQLGDGPVASKLKLYAQVCRHHLAPHLATQPLDKTLLDNTQTAVLKTSEKPVGHSASPMPPSTPESQEKDHASTPKPQDSDAQQENTNTGGGTTTTNTSIPATASGPTQDPWEQDDDQQPPALVIYVVEPFTYSSTDTDLYRLSALGLLRCFTQMLRFLPEHIQNGIQLQVITMDSILANGTTEDNSKRQDQLKDLAFSVFAQCRRILTQQSAVKSLTGFGPAATQDLFLKGKDESNSGPQRMFTPPFILAPMKDKQTELGEMFGDRREKSNILFCSYCLTEDQRWLLASCTNDKGELLETCCVNIEIPNRTRRKKASACKVGLHKLLDFILSVLSASVQPWRLVVGRLGRLGHGELREWASLLSRKSLLRYSRQLRELCRQCVVLGPADTPCILSACLVSLEPDSALRVMADQYTPDDRFNSSCHSCDLSTPQDATCTHILVFPTSATTQSSQATFQQEHIDPLGPNLGDDDIFQALNDDDIAVGQDINDIFRWTESPNQSPMGSPRRDSASQPGSPSGTGGGRHSPFQHGGPMRGSGSMTTESQEEPLQLLQQPLALGYYVSTATTGPLPKWFWSSCPQLEGICPAFLKSALLIHSPSVQQSSDDLLHANPHIRNYHPLDSNLTTDVLRYVLEGYNALSWLSLDPATHDRRSCLPVHIQVLMQLYHAVEILT